MAAAARRGVDRCGQLFRPVRWLTYVPGSIFRQISSDDRAGQDANQLVALLFVAATPLRRTVVAESLRISQGRLSRACTVLVADPPRGPRLEESGDQLGLVSVPEYAATVERHLGQPVPEPLSQAALDTLAIIAYEQPVTRADIRAIRSVDSDAVVETL